jgi:hypothetical protein
MYGLYAPHKHNSAKPDSAIRTFPELLNSVNGWITILANRPCCACTAAALRVRSLQLAPSPAMGELVGSCFLLYTDAALKGSGFLGFGGRLHGLYFTLHIPDDMLGYPVVQLKSSRSSAPC